MLFALKKGISTAIGIATMSIVSAGILGSGHYSSVSNSERAEIEASQLATYLNAVQARINEGYTISKDLNPKNIKNPSGSFWHINKIFRDELNTSPNGLTFSQARTLFINKDDNCVSYPTQTGYWNSASHNNLIPCNMYRVYGPLRTTISANTHFKTSPVIMIERGDKVDTKITNDLTDLSTKPDKDAKKRKINKAMIAIPLLNTDSQADKKIIIQLARTLKAKLQSNASVFYTLQPNNGAPKIESMYDLDSTGGKNHGLSSSLILGPKCIEDPDESCFLNIHLKPLSGLGSGCDDCLKQDGSNSMNKAITFMSESGADDYRSNQSLLVWKSGVGSCSDNTFTTQEKCEAGSEKWTWSTPPSQEPDANDVIAGFVLSDNNDFVIKSASNPVFTVAEDGNKIDIKGGAGKTGIQIDFLDTSGTPSTDLVKLYNAYNSKIELNKNKITVYSTDSVDINSKTVDINSETASLKVSDKITHTIGTTKVLSSESDTSGFGVKFPEYVRFEKDVFFSPTARLHAPITSNWDPYPGDGVSGAEIAKWGQQIPNVAKVAEIISKTSLPLSYKLDILEQQLIIIKKSIP